MERMKKKDALKLSVAVTSEVLCPRSEMTLLRQRSAVVWEVTGLIPRQQLTAGHVGGHCTEFRQNYSLKTFRMHQFKFWVGEATLAAGSINRNHSIWGREKNKIEHYAKRKKPTTYCVVLLIRRCRRGKLYREKVVQWLCRVGKTESTANRFWFLFGLMETF